jgi:RNA polymerase sigma-70 factor (ECF subfamily)
MTFMRRSILADPRRLERRPEGCHALRGYLVYGDGGGKAPQWTTAIIGAERVGPLLLGVGRQMRDAHLTAELRQINGQPGAIIRTAEGSITNVFVLDVLDGLVQTVRSVVNPDKLRHLGLLADVRTLAREVRRT